MPGSKIPCRIFAAFVAIWERQAEALPLPLIMGKDSGNVHILML